LQRSFWYCHQTLICLVILFTSECKKLAAIIIGTFLFASVASTFHLTLKRDQAINNLFSSSSCAGAGWWRVDLGDLLAGTDNTAAVTVLDDHSILVLASAALPDLDFHAAADDTHSHG